ncbi:tetratricopeptide repeat protein [Devosia sp. MC1541]|uniref:tetratricopeptide repeat protein n=1 Tax=Devosia sp. MC1541 TaxID=2725264 RepID=UPI00145EA9F0
MNFLSHRWAKCLIVTASVALLASPIAAQTSFDLSNVARNIINLVRPSVSGAYLAGNQSLAELSTEDAARFYQDAAEADWDNNMLVERAFIALAADGQIGKAASTARRSLELDRNNDLAKLIVATEALKERRYSSVERQLENVTPGSFSGITAYILRAWALVGDNKGAEADTLMKDLGDSGLEDFLVFHRALMAETSGDQKLALQLAERAYDVEPYVARIAEVYARLLANNGRFDEATDVLDEYEAQGISHPLITSVREAVDQQRKPGAFATNVQIGAAEMFHGIGIALTRDRSFDLALLFMRLGTYLDPSADVISLAVGQILDVAGQHEDANSIYDAIPATSAMKATAVVRIAQNLDNMGDREEAIRRLTNIVAINPEDIEAVAALGDLLRTDEQYLEAADAYTKALDITGGEQASDWRYYYVRGIAYERAKEWPKAEADFLRALDLNPDQPQVLNYLGYSWIDMDMHLDRALGMIEKAVEQQPQDGYIIDSLGWAFYKLGRLDEAVETLERSVMLLPNDPEINDHLGDAYWKIGRKNEARFQWTIAKSVDDIGVVTKRVDPKLADGLTPANETK